MEYLTNLSNTFSERIGSILPGILGALLVLIIGLIIAGGVRKLVTRLFKKTNIDERLGSKISADFNLGKFIATLAYYLIVIFVLLLVLDLMGVKNVLEPLQNMLNDFLSYIPNIVAGGIIGFVGYILAKLASEGVGFIANSLEKISDRAGFTGQINLTNIVKQIVFLFVFIPILIIALDALKMDAISEPASEMLGTMMSSIPRILAAAIILAVFYIVGRYIVSIVVELLQNLGADNFAKNMGLGSMLGENTSISKLIGNIAFFFLMFAGIMSAVEKLEMTQISEILNQVFQISGKIFFGLIIMAIGNYVATLAGNAMSKSESNKGLASIVRFAVLGIFVAISLHTMGIAESIVNLAFALTLGAVAVAFALSFGLGGREAAGKQMDKFFDRFDK